MGSRDVSARVNHHHQHRSDRQRRDDTGASSNTRTPDCEDQEEGADEFRCILPHVLSPFAGSTQECPYDARAEPAPTSRPRHGRMVSQVTRAGPVRENAHTQTDELAPTDLSRSLAAEVPGPVR